MSFFTLPKALYESKNVYKVLYHDESCILHKKLTQDLLNREKIIVSHSISFVVSGEIIVNTYDGQEVIVKSGEMMFMPRNSYLMSDFIRGQNSMEAFLFFFDHKILLKFLSNKIKDIKSGGKKPTICKLNSSAKIIHYLSSLKNIYFDETNNKELLEIKILEFLHLIYEGNREVLIETLYASENGKKNKDIEFAMTEHYDKNLTIKDFANLSGYSVCTFNRKFKDIHGITPTQWILDKKIQKAHELLVDGDSATNAALEVGYSSLSHFIKAYKRKYGKTPKQNILIKNR